MKSKLLFCSLILFSLNQLWAQDLRIPSPVDCFQYSVPSPAVYGFPVVRIWGWSPDGKAAYSVERELEGKGGKKFSFIVFDAVTDSVVSSLIIDTFDLGLENKSPEYVYNLLYEKILNVISVNNITLNDAAFLPFPIYKNNTVYDCSIINVKYSPDVYGFHDDNISEYTVLVTSSGRSKIINTFKSDEITRNVYICGYVPSPYEDRVLLVLAEENHVFEGTELFYVFCGCHLAAGFN